MVTVHGTVHDTVHGPRPDKVHITDKAPKHNTTHTPTIDNPNSTTYTLHTHPTLTCAEMKPDLTSVKTLVTSPSTLAAHLQLTTNAIRRWIKVNRIPGSSVIKVANFYDVELVDLLPLTGARNRTTRESA